MHCCFQLNLTQVAVNHQQLMFQFTNYDYQGSLLNNKLDN